MKFANEQLTKMKAAKTVEELITIVKAEGIEVTEEEIKAWFTSKHEEIELAEDELEDVSGGCGEETPDPKFKAGQNFWLGYPTSQTYVKYVVDKPEFYIKGEGWRYLVTNERGFQDNICLETNRYVLTYDPGSEWVF